MLAAILFPVLAKSRDNARRSSCQSNMKQIGLGMLQYTQDYDERYVSLSRTGGIGATPAISWTVAIYPYVKNRNIFQCPSNSTSLTGSNDFTGPINTLNYTYNAHIGGEPCSGSPMGSPGAPLTPGRQLSAIPSPAMTPIVVEAVGIPYAPGTSLADESLIFYLLTGAKVQNFSTFAAIQGRALRNPASASLAWTGSNDVVSFPTTMYGTSMGAPGATIHFHSTNYLFADGHVKSLESPAPTVTPIQPIASTDLDYCPDDVPGTTTSYG